MLQVADTLTSAKVSTFNCISDKSLGFAVVNGQIILVHGAFHSLYLQFPLIFTCTSVLTMYEKGAGKGARHAWTPQATSIGGLSYISVQCYEHIPSWQPPYRFRLMECVATRTRQFHLLPSLAFLCMVPPDSLERVPFSDIIKIRPGPYSDIFHTLLSEQGVVLSSVGDLLAPPGRRR